MSTRRSKLRQTTETASADLGVSVGWRLLQFDEAVEPVSDNGKRVDQREYLTEGAIPVIDQGERAIGGYTNDESRKYAGPLPVIAFGDHTRRVKLIDFPFAVGAQGVKLLRPRDCWEPRFFSLLLSTLSTPDRGYGRHYQYVRQLSFPCPVRAEQRSIVAEIEKQFTRLDAGVAALRRVQANLKRYRASILKAACEGRLVPTLSPWPQSSIEIVIDSLEQGWSPKCDSVPASSPEEWAVIKTTAIQPMRYLEKENKRLPRALKPRGQHELQPGDLLVTRAGPRARVGITCLVRRTRPKLMLCDKAYRLRCKNKVADPAFLELALNSPSVLDAIEGLKSGISDSGLNLTQQRFRELMVPLPPLAEQLRIVAEVDRRLSVLDELEALVSANLQRATRLRQSILQRAFAGEL